MQEGDVMTIDEAKELVVKAGIRLVESGLIARTWGNVSCRISENSFVITPSGRDYRSLTPDEIVAVNISDLSYSGSVKPSTEKGLHSEVYKLHPEMNFVIHTHQDNASVISASGLDSINIQDGHSYLGSEVLCASYALPGTKALRRNIAHALSRSKGKAIIMKYHGALCFGKDYDEAFLVASELENACHQLIVNQYLKLSGKDHFDAAEMNKFSLSLHNKVEEKNNEIFKPYYNSKRSKNGFVLYKDNGIEVEVQTNKIDSSQSEEAKIYHAIYDRYKNIHYIINKHTPEITAVSHSDLILRPLLDDFAQIAGASAKNVENAPGIITAALKKSSVVFVKNRGALCLGKSKDDAIAVGMVTQKACKAYIGASLFGNVKPINPLECALMRFVYLKKYSKQADKSLYI